MGHLRAVSTVQPPSAAPGAYDRCDATWSGWKILVCGAAEAWETVAPGAAECALAVGDMTWRFDVSVARNDMAHTQLVTRFDLPSVDVRCSRRTLERVTAVSLAVYGDVSSRPAVELDDREVSTMVSLASGGVGMLESGWYTLRRREMGMRKGRVSDYARWTRVDASITVGRFCVGLWESDKATGTEKEMVRLVVAGMEASGVVRSLDASASASIASIDLEDHVQTFGDEYKYILRSTVDACGRAPEPVLLGRVHVWNSKSPDRQGLDVHLESTLSQLALGLNLETLGVVQNCVAEALEAGIVRAGALALEEGRQQDEATGAVADTQAATSLIPATPMQMAAAAVSAAGSTVVHAGSRDAGGANLGGVASRLALKFVGTMHAVDVGIFTSRSSAVFPVARLALRECEMTNEESRAGRIEVCICLLVCLIVYTCANSYTYMHV